MIGHIWWKLESFATNIFKGKIFSLTKKRILERGIALVFDPYSLWICENLAQNIIVDFLGIGVQCLWCIQVRTSLIMKTWLIILFPCYLSVPTNRSKFLIFIKVDHKYSSYLPESFHFPLHLTIYITKKVKTVDSQENCP